MGDVNNIIPDSSARRRESKFVLRPLAYPCIPYRRVT